MKVVLDGDVSKFNRSVLSGVATAKMFSKELDTSTDRAANLAQSVLAIGPALVPLATAGVPALAGLSNQLALTAGAAGVAVIAFSGVGEALKAVNDFQIDPTAANFKKLQESMETLGPAGRDFVVYLQSLRPELQRLQDISQAGIFPGFQVGIDEAMTKLPQAERIVEQISSAIGMLAAEGGTELAGPRWQEFFDFLEAEAKPTLMDLGRTVGNLTDGFAQLWIAFAPTSASFSDSFLRMSRDFSQWASAVDETEGFQDFLTYINETGPEVWDTLGALGNALLQVGEAAAPVGALALPILESLADTVAVIADSDVGPVLIGTAAGISAISRAIALYNVANGSALAALLTDTRVGAAWKSGVPAVSEFGTVLFRMGQRAEYADEKTRAARESVARYRPVLAGIAGTAGVVAASMLDLDDAFGVNAATYALAGSALGPWGTAAGAAIGITQDLSASTNRLTDAIDAANRAADGGTIEQRNAAMAALREEVEKAAAGEAGFGQRIAEWAEYSQHGGDAMAGVAAIVDRFTTSSSEAGEQLAELETRHAAARREAQDQAFTEAGLGDAMIGASDAAREQTAALLENADAKNAAKDEALKALDAELAYEAAIDAAAKAARENANGVDSNTEAGRKNLALLSDLASGWNNLSPAQQNATGAADRARRAFIRAAEGMGASRTQARQLADQLLRVPTSVQTKVRVDGIDYGLRALRALQDGLNNLSPFKDVTIRTTRENITRDIKVQGGTQKAMADGGRVEGPGGPRDDLIPALLSNGEFVVNARATAANLPLLERMNNATRFADGGLAARPLRATDIAGAAVTARAVSPGPRVLSASLAGARVEIGADGLGRFVDGRIDVAFAADDDFEDANRRAGR
ncbi:hypothetical protein [Aeromicrobium sp. SORGH_AS_0981]|uniref:hypothetical protein n=1 Tax=Aeromicrobium sp. SORGH_AS_0981 TaxID=3041802 RepID=UPI002869F29E|nr:hypothetical protein [Aeromicrobium sp. SORGH_AS_0981]